MAGLAALGLLAVGCSTGGMGPRDEGPAPSGPVARSPSTTAPTATASSVKKVDAVALLKSDPKVSKRAKADLRPCAADAYAIDTSYGSVTGNATAPDVVVNLMTCGDAVGIGTYVYRATNGTYENVFAKEEPAVYATIDRGDLVVTQQVYAKDDPVTYPSGEIVTTYRWSGSTFTEHDRVQNEYSRVVGGEEEPPPTSAPSED
ncbi:hypothetical protein HHX38_00110 [Streptomyces sp. PKU-MA01144]|uniref:hypothetical protein n=1 Tax=Streptomyces TaxID=1883 RepID=UPI000372DD74|nr:MULTISPECIES: hypothetical protein [Streptomyces]MCY0981909.1 hypothetical protein [Streptomyces tirandamycinicus]NNJ02557.1 hypothetical protein [Streptomyces sp. PKU-MA01144]